MSYARLTDEELYECYECALECLGETEAQYGSEVALYGDAWPGAQIQIADMRADLVEIEAELAARRPEPEALALDEAVGPVYDDIPF